jgi:hypothetical protein
MGIRYDGSELLFPIKKGDWFTFFANSNQKEAARNHIAIDIKGVIVESRCGRFFENPWKLVEDKKRGRKERLYPDCKVCLKCDESDKATGRK